MNKRRWLPLLLAVLCVLSLVPITASAAEASVVEIDGERVAFFSSFGRMSYNGKSYTSFKSFNDALAALGKEGGKIAFTGSADASDFKDIEGRGPLTIEGVGTKARTNVLYFSGQSEINLKGDLYLDFLNLRMEEGAYLYTNGYAFETINEFDTYNTEQYVANGPNTFAYPNPPSVAPGTVQNGDAAVYLDAGTYTTLAAGSVNGKTVKGNTYVKLGGGTVENVVAGNIGNGTMDGSAKLVIGEGNITKLVAGSSGGTVNGNVTTVINGGTIASAVIGAEAGAVINGNVIVALNGGSVEGTVTAGAGTVTGKKIVITGAETVANIASGAADYIIRMNGGLCEPQTEGNTLTGFLFTDEYGIPARSITVNGAARSSENGVYTLDAGTSTVEITTLVKIAVNRNASYVAGYDNGTFAPQKNMTRAEAITLLTRLITDENIIRGYVHADYGDVAHGAWYESYIGLFQKLGYLDTIEGKHGAVIYPDQNITRGEFVELIYRIRTMDSPSASVKLGSFTDVSTKNPYIAAINDAVSAGIVAGYEDGTFRPDKNITRAEVVTIVNRFLGRTPNGAEGTVTFNDVDGHWAKSQILAACNEENVTWTASETGSSEYVLSGSSAKDYVTGLYEQSSSLSATAIRSGVDTIAEQMKKDILNTGNTADYYDLTGKTIYYISEKNGSDDNDGKSPETAFKTVNPLSKLRLVKAGTLAVLFERGGIYRGQITPMNGAIYGSYGEGSKPLLMQSRKDYADPALWVETEYPNVWKCTDKLINVGVIGFDHDLFDYSSASYDEKYGIIMNLNTFGFTGVQDLDTDLQFYSDVTGGLNGVAGDLFVYSEGGNPGSRFKSIEIGEKVDIVDGGPSGCTIDNLAFKFTGAHAIGFGTSSDVVVTNCVFSWLGGSVLTKSDNGSAVNYGNAVEIYGGCKNYRVENCWMYQIYDTAVTHQRSRSTGNCTQEGIRYLSNLMEYVHWGIEFYNAPPTAEQLQGKPDTYTRYTKDVHDAYNLLRMGGYGWGSIVRYRTTSARLYCGSTLSDNSDELTEYNIFDRCAGYLLNLPANAKEVQDKNIYIQTIGCTLGTLRGTTYTCGYDAADLLRDKWGDKNAVVVVVEPEE